MQQKKYPRKLTDYLTTIFQQCVSSKKPFARQNEGHLVFGIGIENLYQNALIMLTLLIVGGKSKVILNHFNQLVNGFLQIVQILRRIFQRMSVGKSMLGHVHFKSCENLPKEGEKNLNSYLHRVYDRDHRNLHVLVSIPR